MSKRCAGCLVAIGFMLVAGSCLGLLVAWVTGLWWLAVLGVAGQ